MSPISSLCFPDFSDSIVDADRRRSLVFEILGPFLHRVWVQNYKRASAGLAQIDGAIIFGHGEIASGWGKWLETLGSICPRASKAICAVGIEYSH